MFLGVVIVHHLFVAVSSLGYRNITVRAQTQLRVLVETHFVVTGPFTHPVTVLKGSVFGQHAPGLYLPVISTTILNYLDRTAGVLFTALGVFARLASRSRPSSRRLACRGADSLSVV
ncbi:hypothetical protein BKA56DRAFT_573514 [Ilyonectria sp. MPI-CAGE-AT-0026]|nr:hypothetical protein BKA56DRAFT_573514 [Ilyonectria sp. MPI-CAGE-AT-0026]